MSAIVLVGAPGSGKSAVAAELSKAGWRVWESDAAASAATNSSRSEAYLAERGDEFAAAAAAAARERLAALGDSPSAGTAQNAAPGEVLVFSSEVVDDPAVRADLARFGAAGGSVVHLDADLAALTRRLGFTAPGGLAALTPRAMLRQMRRERLPLYQQVATSNVDTSFLTVAEVAARVLGAAL
ncbi:shikimate kinase [Buchananella felis]|uniref:shikimate kinase n=1 Tax=Buchananella felis TaxID=3231492 RepID=UPI003528F1B3